MAIKLNLFLTVNNYVNNLFAFPLSLFFVCLGKETTARASDVQPKLFLSCFIFFQNLKNIWKITTISEFSLCYHANKMSMKGIISLKRLTKKIKLEDENHFKCPDDACANVATFWCLCFQDSFHTSHNINPLKLDSHYTSWLEILSI